MTRAEIHNKLNIEGSISKANVIDFMWEHFMSRKCENCRHNKEYDGEFIFCDAEMPSIMGWHLFGKDFGCNKWEASDDR